MGRLGQLKWTCQPTAGIVFRLSWTSRRQDVKFDTLTVAMCRFATLKFARCRSVSKSIEPESMNMRKLQYGLAVAGALALAGCTTGGSFKQADQDQSGGISFSEFDAHMKASIFKAVDANGDGHVTQEEWRKVNEKDAVSEFSATDRNGDGKISRAEADAGFDKEGSLKDLFKKIDTDGNGSLSQEEVKAFHELMKKQPGKTELDKLSNAAEAS